MDDDERNDREAEVMGHLIAAMDAADAYGLDVAELLDRVRQDR